MSTPPPAHVEVIRPRPVAGPALRLFLLHHVGGSSLAFSNWPQWFPADWDICLVETPGRGRLAHLAPYDCVTSLARGFTDSLNDLRRTTDTLDLLDAPFALYGHSMGGLVAYETTLWLTKRGRPAPVWMGISACGSPDVASAADTPPPLHTLPGAQLREALRQWGGLPPAAFEDDGLWALLEPRIRADFALVENWRAPSADQGRISVPLSLFGGIDDPLVSAKDLLTWGHRADRLVGQHFFPGGHFYFTGQEQAVADQIVMDAGS
ncbi:alpha/beta fold hydrolase [Streptomyces sp. NPDC046853]|uniref:thioesterase II family protein n=1 Tax=Streptomyces sp. NPDC046853 TaxID=3154920 RepID=UPI0033F53782